jgi:deoxyribodipyrimidine photo-lyase
MSDVIRALERDRRVFVRRPGPPDPEGRAVVYWMQRAQRGLDNPALDAAILAGNALGLPVAVFFGLHPGYPGGNRRHYTFLIEGLPETARRIEERGAAFIFRPYPEHDLIRFAREARAALVIGDENPLRAPEGWRARAAERLSVPFWTVDADVIVPSRHFERAEYMARTIRPKLARLIPSYLRPLVNPVARVRFAPAARPGSRPIDPPALLRELSIPDDASPVASYRGGTAEGLRLLDRFLRERLARYGEDRNRPDLPGTSELSAYLHFGQLGPHTVALAVAAADASAAAKAAFLEELIVRRELAVNFVAHTPLYDRLAGAPAWGRRTLDAHAADERVHRYQEAELESAATHDPLWNAAQVEMVREGRMHGYMRMYWAKKLLEWTESPVQAFEIAVRLNDRYQLDGRDPNGYTGIGWAIGGTHDRPWPPHKEVLGLIRPMTFNGLKRKFPVADYVRRVAGA